MARSRKGIVSESFTELEVLASRCRGTDRTSRVEFLIELRRSPERTFDDLAELLNHTERTLRRWWQTYQEKGIAALIDLPEATNIDSIGLVASPELQMLFRFRTLLNSLPTTTSTFEWVESMRASLQQFLVDVDRVALNINMQCDLEGDNDQSGMFITQHVNTETLSKRSRPTVTVQRMELPPGELLIKEAANNGVSLKEYHVPYYQDYYLNGRVYLGTIILWRRRNRRPIPSSTITLLRSLDEFMIFLMSDCVARRQKVDPDLRIFQQVIDSVAERIGLTDREKEVFTLQVLGRKYEEIAEVLKIAVSTVAKHMGAILKKAGTSSYGELFAQYFTPVGREFQVA